MFSSTNYAIIAQAVGVCKQPFSLGSVLCDHEIVVEIVHQDFRQIKTRKADVNWAIHTDGG